MTGDRPMQHHVRTPEAEQATEPRADAELLRTMAGEWIVLDGDRLVGHGPDPVALVERARAMGIEVPAVLFVDPTPPDVIKIGL